MGGKPGSREIRREQIRQRIDAIHARVAALQTRRKDDADRAAALEWLTLAQRQMAASQAAARTAISNGLHAFRTAAEAHERAALLHERAAAAGFGDKDEHERQASCPPVCPSRQYRYSAPGVETTLYSRLVG